MRLTLHKELLAQYMSRLAHESNYHAIMVFNYHSSLGHLIARAHLASYICSNFAYHVIRNRNRLPAVARTCTRSRDPREACIAEFSVKIKYRSFHSNHEMHACMLLHVAIYPGSYTYRVVIIISHALLTAHACMHARYQYNS